jgi:hypothetical protein
MAHSKATLGWMIEVSERRLGGNPCTRRYYVAVVDEKEALSTVRGESETANPTVRAKRKIYDENGVWFKARAVHHRSRFRQA